MSLPMLIEFSMYVPNEDIARRVVEIVSPEGFTPDIYWDEKSETWSVYCGKQMLATYEGIIACQKELNDMLKSLDVRCDGWGTHGNGGD